jgi:exosortase
LSLISTYFAENSVMTSRRGLVWQMGGLLLLLTLIYAPILSAMVEHWRIVPDYSHGFLIVPLAFIFAYEKKYLLQAATLKGSWWGVGLLAVGLSLLALGQLGSLLAPLRAGYVFGMMGLVLLLLGKDAFFLLLFPMAFLLMMVPLPQSVVNIIAFPLQLIAAEWAVSLLQLIGIPVLLEGNIIHLAGGDLFVAEACSGLRSLMALLTLGIVFAHFFRRESLFQQILLVASTIPIAIVVNSLRVAVTGILAHTYGQETATGFIHEFQGIITFSLAFLLLLGESKILARLLDRGKDAGTA